MLEKCDTCTWPIKSNSRRVYFEKFNFIRIQGSFRTIKNTEKGQTDAVEVNMWACPTCGCVFMTEF